MREDIRLWGIAVAASCALAIAALLAFHPEGWIGLVAYWPVVIIGGLGILAAVLAGARRLWLMALPLLLIPILPWVMLLMACRFNGDCV